jgi:hypothetical protein
MNLLSKCLYGIVAIVCFSSCKKDSNPDSTVNNKDTLLSKVVIWDSLSPANGAFTREFIFDDQQRVTMLIVYGSDTNGVRLLNSKTDTSLQCFYNGTEKNAYRTIGWSLFSPYKGADVLHFYNNSNQIIKDSLKYSATSYSTRTYAYSTDKLITYDVNVSNILPTTFGQDTFLVANNDITYANFNYPPGIGFDLFEIAYDDKINPLNKLNIANLRLIEGGSAFDKGTYLSPGFSKNNMTQMISKDSDPNLRSQDKETFQYTYNDINLPVYCKISSTYYNSSSRRLKYMYTH